MTAFVKFVLKILVVSAISFSFVSCGPSGLQDDRGLRTLAASGSGAFNGTWKVTLKTLSDGCGLGLAGKSFPANVVISQRGNSITLTIQGIGKAYKGKVTGNTASASGAYTTGGVKISGSVKAQKKNAKTLKIVSAVVTLKGDDADCTMRFSGSGSK